MLYLTYNSENRYWECIEVINNKRYILGISKEKHEMIQLLINTHFIRSKEHDHNLLGKDETVGWNG